MASADATVSVKSTYCNMKKQGCTVATLNETIESFH